MRSPPPPDLADIAVFVKVLDHGSLAGAARALAQPTSTVSRTIARLEAALGARLLHRTTRAVRPTAEGQQLFDAVSGPVGQIQLAARSLDAPGGVPRGRLRISAPGDLGSALVAQVVVRFVARFPAMTVEVELSNRMVDLVREGFDVALRVSGRLADSTLIAHRAGIVEDGLVASAAWVARHGRPSSLDQVDAKHCVLYRPRGGAETWRLAGPDGTVQRVVHGRIAGDDFGFVKGLVLADAGIALLPLVLVRRELDSGSLIRVLPRYGRRLASLWVVYPTARHLPEKVAVFRDLLAAEFSAVEQRRTGAG